MKIFEAVEREAREYANQPDCPMDYLVHYLKERYIDLIDSKVPGEARINGVLLYDEIYAIGYWLQVLVPPMVETEGHRVFFTEII